MAKATPQGRKPHTAPKSQPDSGRQSNTDGSQPTIKPPKATATPGGEGKSSTWGGHLQGK
jgi:hypothetical protein